MPDACCAGLISTALLVISGAGAGWAIGWPHLPQNRFPATTGEPHLVQNLLAILTSLISHKVNPYTTEKKST
jgi:hypothetical protein